MSEPHPPNEPNEPTEPTEPAETAVPETGRAGEDSIFGSRRLSAALHPASLSFALVGLLLTTFAASTLYRSQKEALASQFKANLESVHRTLEQRLSDTEQLLGTARAYLAASGGPETLAGNPRWNGFLAGLEAPERHPGICGLGYAATVSPEERADFEAEARRDGLEGYAVRSTGDHPLYVPVLRYEGLSDACREKAAGAAGFDLMAEPAGGKALAWARDLGVLSVSAVGSLRGEFGPGGTPSFLVCLPVYGGEEPPSTIAERRAAIQGYLFCVVEVGKFLSAVVGAADSDIGLRILDSSAPASDRPMFASAESSVAADFRSTMEVHLGGHHWTVEAFSLSAFEDWVSRLSSLFLALSGVAITLLGMMVLADSKAKQERAARLAREKSESLRRSEAEVRKLNVGLEAAVAARTASLEEAVGELRAFSYTVSHDLRAPVRHVQFLADLVAEEHGTELSEGARGYFDRIREAAGRMHRLIEEILQLASCSKVALRPRRTDLSALSSEIVEELVPRVRGRAVRVEIPPGMEIEGDPVVLRTVMQNLLENAFKFTSKLEVAEISVGLGESGGAPEVFVRDNGVGFEMEQAEAVFQLFKRLHRESEYEGTGVGLATVRKMVRRHGGEIRAESAVGAGTTFRFTLGEVRPDFDEEGGAESPLVRRVPEEAPLPLAR